MSLEEIQKELTSIEASAKVLAKLNNNLAEEAARLRLKLQPVSTGGKSKKEVLSQDQIRTLLAGKLKRQLRNANV